MSDHDPLGPGRSRQGRLRRWVSLSLILLTISLAGAAMLLEQGGYVGKGLLPSLVCFIAASAIGVLMSADIEREAAREHHARYQEIAPPADVLGLWQDGIQRPTTAALSARAGWRQEKPACPKGAGHDPSAFPQR